MPGSGRQPASGFRGRRKRRHHSCLAQRRSACAQRGADPLAGAERILVPTFRIPTLIHTRSGNAKWLNEISHRHPLWLHPADAERLGIDVGGLARVTTRIGHFVIAWAGWGAFR